MRKVQAILVTLLLLAITVRVMAWSLEPLLPYIVGGLVIIAIYGWFFRRKW